MPGKDFFQIPIGPAGKVLLRGFKFPKKGAPDIKEIEKKLAGHRGMAVGDAPVTFAFRHVNGVGSQKFGRRVGVKIEIIRTGDEKTVVPIKEAGLLDGFCKKMTIAEQDSGTAGMARCPDSPQSRYDGG